MGGLVQSTSPCRVRARDAWLRVVDGTRLQRALAENLKPLPTYAQGAFAVRPARLAMRRSVGMLFPQTARLDDRLGPGWAAVAIDQAAGAGLEEAGIRVLDPGPDGDWLRDRGLAWALLRPDRFVFACGGRDDVHGAIAAWHRILSPTRAPVGT
jgi:hypothetical protein